MVNIFLLSLYIDSSRTPLRTNARGYQIRTLEFHGLVLQWTVFWVFRMTPNMYAKIPWSCPSVDCLLGIYKMIRIDKCEKDNLLINNRLVNVE